MSSRAYNRDVSRRKALRKRRIDRSKAYGRYYVPYYDNLHQYSKNKIHCYHHADAHDGVKTNNRGRQKWYGVSFKRCLLARMKMVNFIC